MKVVVGLGNFGREYDNTRHNIGFMVLDSLGLSFREEKKFQALISNQKIEGESVLFVKPLTYMNLSGIAVQKIVSFYQIPLENILIIQDDMDLAFGTFRLKKNSSSGGHNGIKSIISALHSEEFCRLKIGIGHEDNGDVVDYVLGHFSKSDLQSLEESFPLYQKIITSFIKDGVDKTMNFFNKRG